jgi:hypothetical protein
MASWLQRLFNDLRARRRLAPVIRDLNTIVLESHKIYAKLDLKRALTAEANDFLAKEILQRIADILDSEDRFRECRRQIHQSVREFARLQVLNISASPEPDITGFRGTQGITGKLQTHLVEIISADKLLTELMEAWRVDLTDQEKIHNTMTILYQRAYWISHTMNICRAATGDYNPEIKDWFRPFVHAMCVWSESEYRKQVGLEPAIVDDKLQLIAMVYAGFGNIVLSCTLDPLASWKEKADVLLRNGSLTPPYWGKWSKDKTVGRRTRART